jgi:hypothetical protein
MGMIEEDYSVIYRTNHKHNIILKESPKKSHSKQIYKISTLSALTQTDAKAQLNRECQTAPDQINSVSEPKMSILP